MQHSNFATPEELVQYVADNAVLQADIVTITFKDGRWYLFHF